MVFDKNVFKDAFRAWVQAHPKASEEDALAFCQARIPANQVVKHYWLVEQSLQWFTWLKSRRAFEHDDFREDDADLGLMDGARPLH